MEPHFQKQHTIFSELKKNKGWMKQHQEAEKGITLLLALLIGMIILGGASALMVKQLSNRRITKGESYEQIAENAAANGFNQILSALNNTTPGEYLGYLFINDYDGSSASKWVSDITLEQPCSKNKNNNGSAPSWMINRSNTSTASTETLLSSKSGDVRSEFNLRAYYAPKEGQSATFEVEGFARKGNSNKSYEARSLLRRSLYINSRVSTADDWAVLAARNLELGRVRINGEGKILWLMPSIGNFDNLNSCNSTNLLAAVGASSEREPRLAERIWPVVNRTGNQWDIPTAERFNRDGTVDKIDGAQRIWAFDDTRVGNPINENYGLKCNGEFSVICSRPTSTMPKESQYSRGIAKDQIEMVTENKTSSGGHCVMKTNWTSNGLYKGDIYPDTNISKRNCEKENWREWVETIEYEIPQKRTVIINANDLCNERNGENVCHVFVEHLNLTNTQIFIENGDRPVVLHLNLPAGGGVRRSDLSAVGYSLQGISKICGSTGQTSKQCNNVPEWLVITSSSGNIGATCNTSDSSSTLSFGGNSLPSAWINLAKGTVAINSDTTLKGTIWANNICTQSSHKLDLETNGVIESAEEFWEWDEQKRYGRKVIRGIRGTGFDTFTRF